MGDTATVLLVHGSWHGEWCWGRVKPALERRGIAARTLQLPSCTPALGGLMEDAAAVAAAAAAIAGPVVVCAHSYGGMPTTQARLPANVRALVYLCAFMPVEGASLISHFPPGPLPPYVALRDDGTTLFVKEMAGPVLYNDCSAEDVAWAAAQLVPQSQAAVGTPPDHCAWRTLPSTYVVCTKDNTIPPDIQRAVAANASEVRELAASHSPMLSQPDAVAGILAEVAARNAVNAAA